MVVAHLQKRAKPQIPTIFWSLDMILLSVSDLGFLQSHCNKLCFKEILKLCVCFFFNNLIPSINNKKSDACHSNHH